MGLEEARLGLAFALGVNGLGGVFSIRFRTSSREFSSGTLDMLDPSKPFFQARLKHIWANQHINRLHQIWEAFLKTDFCEVRIQDKPDGTQSLRVVSVGPLPAELLLALGDAVHNLRCTLDYVIAELLGWKDTRLTFPMGEEREELIASFRTEPEKVGQKTIGKGRNAAIESAIAGIGKFIVDEIGAYKGGSGNAIWTLNKLDVRDKHRLLLPVLVPQTIKGINATTNNGMVMSNATASIDPGGEVGLMRGPGLKIQSYGKATAEIFFYEVGIIEDQPIFPTLVQMSQAVIKTVDAVAVFAASVGWQRPNA